ncbi:ImmA/IrrE family metallo-endopeptidase [Desulfitibacter alkalitolerans]|uniref:ImmA/IrrE family metallo-endopeptidase n=1 Tax=Desulfitibacter alkalitolerans TaxID=264641 RepID=UPI00047F3659|nr:ImmA/IrrE family metallo-endopeptidase [Desulfitibacter alkalitolerans]
MLKFSWNKRDKNRVPIMSAREMDELAEELVSDYKPELIKDPQPINYEHFLEFYLGVNLEYQDIRSDNPDEHILGMTAFGDDFALVYDNDAGRMKRIDVREGTVVLNTELLAEEKAGRLRFTALHEGAGHWWCHQDYYGIDKNQLTFFTEERPRAIMCRSYNLENFAYRKCATPVDWMEYQADYMASAIAMPKTPFMAAAANVLKTAGFKERFIVTGVDVEYDIYAELGLPAQIADMFGVSRKAAEIKLKNFGFIKDIKKVKEEAKQRRLY